MKAKLVLLPRERTESGWINCRKYVIDLTFCSTYRHLCSTCKWYLLSVNKNFVKISIKNCKLNVYFARNYHLGNIFAEVITIKTLFASAKPSVIADCRGKFRGLFCHAWNSLNKACWVLWALQNPQRILFKIFFHVLRQLIKYSPFVNFRE